MSRTVRSHFLLFALSFALLPVYAQDTSPEPRKTVATDTTEPSKADNDAPLPAGKVHNPVLWQEPTDIASRNLFLGLGGESHQPKPPFVFESEERDGTNPKFDIRDADDKKWRVKMGEEAKPEVVASRLLWAVGYFANEDYLLHVADVKGLALKRGGDQVKNAQTGTGQVIDVRFSRKPGGQNKIAIWTWKQNPFEGTREFNGLRVMMAVMNNWDLKDVNNSVYYDKKNDQQIFLVNDVGASFGSNGLGWTKARSKGNINSFKDSKFITRETATEVDFATPKAPTGMLLLTAGATAKSYAMRSGLDWIGNNIPREHARWMGSLLGQLSHEQITDAFRAGNFPADQIEAYVEVVETRIAELKKL